MSYMLWSMSLPEFLAVMLVVYGGAIMIKLILRFFKVRKSNFQSAFENPDFAEIYHEYHEEMKNYSRAEKRGIRKEARKQKRKAFTKDDKDLYYYQEKLYKNYLITCLVVVLLVGAYKIIDGVHTEKTYEESVIQVANVDNEEYQDWKYNPGDIEELSYNDDNLYMDYLNYDGFSQKSETYKHTADMEYGLYTIKLADGVSEASVSIKDDTFGTQRFALSEEYPQIVNVKYNQAMEISTNADVDIISQTEYVNYDENKQDLGFYIFGKSYDDLSVNIEDILANDLIVEAFSIYENELYAISEYKQEEYGIKTVNTSPGFSFILSR